MGCYCTKNQEQSLKHTTSKKSDSVDVQNAQKNDQDKSEANIKIQDSDNGNDKLKDFELLWVDQTINNPENKRNQGKLETSFSKSEFTEDASKINNLIDNSARPVIVVSSGSKFEEIKAHVESNNNVVAVFILDSKCEDYKHYKDKCRKVVDVVNCLENLKTGLSGVYDNFRLFLRFSEVNNSKLFYNLGEKEEIQKLLKAAYKQKAHSIFYPLGAKLINYNDRITKENLTKIEKKAESDPKLASHLRRIKSVLRYLESRKSSEDIIKSYTMGKLDLMLGTYAVPENKKGLRLFNEYMYCFKSSICEKAMPVAMNKGAKVYRFLNLNDESIKQYEENKGQTLFLRKFTSTTQDENKAEQLAKKYSGVLLEITLVVPDDAFVKSVADFIIEKDAGVFFPADISEFSVSSSEKEVLFPPFYPIKINDVLTISKEGIELKVITAHAPTSVCIMEKEWQIQPEKDPIEQAKCNEVYIEAILDLVKKKCLDKLCISKFGIVQGNKIHNDLESTLGSDTEISKVIIEDEKLSTTNVLLEKIVNIKCMKHLSLRNNEISEQGGYIIGVGLKAHSTLIELNLEENKLKDEGIVKIGEALLENKVLIVLRLGGNMIGDDGAKIIAEGIRKKSPIKSLHLNNNQIRSIGASHIAQTLRENHTLKELDMSKNSIGDEGAHYIAQALRVNKVLLSINLLYNKIQFKGRAELEIALKSKTTGSMKNINSSFSLIH